VRFADRRSAGPAGWRRRLPPAHRLAAPLRGRGRRDATNRAPTRAHALPPALPPAPLGPRRDHRRFE
jgi:hypothetical protein